MKCKKQRNENSYIFCLMAYAKIGTFERSFKFEIYFRSIKVFQNLAHLLCIKEQCFTAQHIHHSWRQILEFRHCVYKKRVTYTHNNAHFFHWKIVRLLPLLQRHSKGKYFKKCFMKCIKKQIYYLIIILNIQTYFLKFLQWQIFLIHCF